MNLAQTASTTDPALVLGKAVINAGEQLGFNATQVGQIVGKDRTTIGRGGIKPDSLHGMQAMLLIRLYRSLFALVGGDQVAMQHWMSTRIRSLNGVPQEMAFDVVGLVHLVEYLDAIRGKS